MLLESLARGGNDRTMTLSCVSLPRDLFSVEDIPNESNVGTSVALCCCRNFKGRLCQAVANCPQDSYLGNWSQEESPGNPSSRSDFEVWVLGFRDSGSCKHKSFKSTSLSSIQDRRDGIIIMHRPPPPRDLCDAAMTLEREFQKASKTRRQDRVPEPWSIYRFYRFSLRGGLGLVLPAGNGATECSSFCSSSFSSPLFFP